MWMMPLHLHVNQKLDYDDMMNKKLFPILVYVLFWTYDYVLVTHGYSQQFSSGTLCVLLAC